MRLVISIIINLPDFKYLQTDPVELGWVGGWANSKSNIIYITSVCVQYSSAVNFIAACSNLIYAQRTRLLPSLVAAAAAAQ